MIYLDYNATTPLSPEAFAERCLAMRQRLMRKGLSDAALVDECFALIREASRRSVGAGRPTPRPP